MYFFFKSFTVNITDYKKFLALKILADGIVHTRNQSKQRQNHDQQIFDQAPMKHPPPLVPVHDNIQTGRNE